MYSFVIRTHFRLEERSKRFQLSIVDQVDVWSWKLTTQNVHHDQCRRRSWWRRLEQAVAVRHPSLVAPPGPPPRRSTILDSGSYLRVPFALFIGQARNSRIVLHVFHLEKCSLPLPIHRSVIIAIISTDMGCAPSSGKPASGTVCMAAAKEAGGPGRKSFSPPLPF